MNKEELKGQIEALLFASGDPMYIEEIWRMLEIVPDTLEIVLSEMNDDYLKEERGIYIIRMDDRIQLATKPMYSSTVKKLATVNERQTLGKGALECLAIIAYKQPVTRAEIDEIRGVSSEYVLNKLLERNFTVIVGRKDVPGRPRLYGTSEEFLKQFGFKDLSVFKKDKDFKKLMEESIESDLRIVNEDVSLEDNED